PGFSEKPGFYASIIGSHAIPCLLLSFGMASVGTQRTGTLHPAPITSIQPGGGFCFELERVWGKLRRAYLRRFRLRYVEQMLGKRQGDCPDCPHDIIDPRDLKLYRNVCGFWFHPDDDPFRYRDRLRLARAGLAELVFFSALCGILLIVSWFLGFLLHPSFYI